MTVEPETCAAACQPAPPPWMRVCPPRLAGAQCHPRSSILRSRRPPWTPPWARSLLALLPAGVVCVGGLRRAGHPLPCLHWPHGSCGCPWRRQQAGSAQSPCHPHAELHCSCAPFQYRRPAIGVLGFGHPPLTGETPPPHSPPLPPQCGLAPYCSRRTCCARGSNTPAPQLPQCQ